MSGIEATQPSVPRSPPPPASEAAPKAQPAPPQATWKPAGDGFEGGDMERAGAQRGPIQGQLLTPDQLQRADLPRNGILGQAADGRQIGLGDDPGNYLCERAFYTSTEKANEPGTSILRNGQGEPLTGFIHVSSRDPNAPASDNWAPDPITNGTQTRYDMAARQRGVADVVGRGIRGFADEAAGQLGPKETVRVLVTGYDAFYKEAEPEDRVVNNPTGEFVSHQQNIDAAMRAAYGDRLLGPGQEVKNQPNTWRYQVREGAGVRTIEVAAQLLPVDAGAVNGGPQSMQKRIDAFKPHAVISLGTDPRQPRHLIEHHADNGGFFGRGTQTRQAERGEDAPATHAWPENLALARAVYGAGQRPQAPRVAANQVRRQIGVQVDG